MMNIQTYIAGYISNHLKYCLFVCLILYFRLLNNRFNLSCIKFLERTEQRDQGNEKEREAERLKGRE